MSTSNGPQELVVATDLIKPEDYHMINSGKLAVILTALTEGKGTMTLEQFCNAFGKQKGHVKAKLGKQFTREHLSKIEKCLTVDIGNGAQRTVTTYHLDRHTIVALAMSYDLMLGLEVSKLLEAALCTIATVDKAAEAGDIKAIARAVREFQEKSLALITHSETHSERETRSVSLNILKRRSPPPLAPQEGSKHD